MNISVLEQKMLKKANQNHGCLTLDFRDPEHYQFYVSYFGGEERLKKQAPALFAQLKQQQVLPPPDGSLMEQSEQIIHLTPFDIIDDPAITLPRDMSVSDSNYSLSTISCTLRSSNAQDNICAVGSSFKVYDLKSGMIIKADNYVLSPNPFGEFNVDVNLNISLAQQNLGHTYQFSSLFTKIATFQDNETFLDAKLVTSTVVTANAASFIKQMTLSHPIIRENRSGTDLEKYICISYNRNGNIQHPDYSYTIHLSSKTGEMPVYLPFCLEVELTDEASFESVDNNYFDNLWDPQIWLMNLSDDKNTPISTGAAPFLTDWKSFSDQYVQASLNPTTNKINKLKLFYGESNTAEWPSNLNHPVPQSLWSVSTYACFYANIAFNISYGQGIQSTLPVIIQFMVGMEPSNHTGAGINNIYIPRLYFQWGCFAKDTDLYSIHGIVRSQDVRVGDSLLTCDGTYRTVKDVITGPSDSICRITLADGKHIRVTEDHPLFLANGESVSASNLQIGCTLQTFDTETGTPGASEVVDLQTLPYHRDTVYNFVFDEPTLLVAQGIVSGDHAFQQKIRPVKLSPYKLPQPNRKAALISEQFKNLTEMPAVPAFIESVSPKDPYPKAFLYYYPLKAMLASQTLYTEEEAQQIAEFCAFMESNATYGGIKVNSVPTKISSRGLSMNASDGFYVKLIPTAMETWYDSDELNKDKHWNNPAPLDPGKEDFFSYPVRQDILVPFHYPVADRSVPSGTDPETVSSYPDFIKKMLEDIIAKSKEKDAPSQFELHMGIGTALHLLLDSMLHENYSGYQSWQNFKRAMHIIDHQKKDQSSSYPPYKNFPFEKFTTNEKCPTGIEQTGFCIESPYILFDYSFPRTSDELSPANARTVPPYMGYKTFDNSIRFRRALHEMLKFLYRFKGKELDDLTWKNHFEIPFTEIFNRDIITKDTWEQEWSNHFPSVTFTYNAAEVYQKLTTEKEGTYPDLFSYILMLNQIQNGGNLYD